MSSPSHNGPVGTGGNVFIASDYRYGDINVAFVTHHGVDFGNPDGTPLVAVAPGTIYYAGDDLSRQFSSHLNFYGNLVVKRVEGDVQIAAGDIAFATLVGHRTP